MQKLNRKFGLLTAICMVVGTVIGSGLFFKAQTVLVATNGDLPVGIAAWLISGLIMIICSLQFAMMATKYEKINGVVDYAEATCGKGYAYYLAWFMVNIYYPGMTSVLAWVSARYFGVLFGWNPTGAEVLAFSVFAFSVVCFFSVFSAVFASLAAFTGSVTGTVVSSTQLFVITAENLSISPTEYEATLLSEYASTPGASVVVGTIRAAAEAETAIASDNTFTNLRDLVTFFCAFEADAPFSKCLWFVALKNLSSL
jgi:amino acid transporter